LASPAFVPGFIISANADLRCTRVTSLLTLPFDVGIQDVDFSVSSPRFLDETLVMLTLVLLVETWQPSTTCTSCLFVTDTAASVRTFLLHPVDCIGDIERFLQR
jgi:hypothetical protein